MTELEVEHITRQLHQPEKSEKNRYKDFSINRKGFLGNSLHSSSYGSPRKDLNSLNKTDRIQSKSVMGNLK